MVKNEIITIAKKAKSLEEIFDNVNDSLKENENFDTMSILIDRGLPTFSYAREEKENLINVVVPWNSIAGYCIKNGEKIITDAHDPRHYKKPAEITKKEIRYIIAIPLIFLSRTFACIEFLTKSAPSSEEQKEFENLADILAPIVYFREWYEIERRKAHAIKNEAFAAMLALEPEIHRSEINEILNEHLPKITELSEDFLKFTDVEYRREERKENSIAKIVRSVAEKLENLSRFHGKEVEILQEVKDFKIFCNEYAIREEVLFNIVKNVWEAWESRQQEERKIKFSTYKKNSYCMIEIEDNAGGIPKNIAEKLFTAFTTSKGKGRGLGMKIAYQVIKQYNGNIFFKTEEGKGSTFYIEFPVETKV